MSRHRTSPVTAALACALLAALAAVAAVGCGQDTIADGVKVATLDVGAMKSDAARSLVQRRLSGTTDAPVAVLFKDNHYVLRPEVAQARLDVDATVDAALDAGKGDTVAARTTYARGAVQAFAGRIAQRIDRPARDADIDWHDGKLDRTRARPGLTVDRAALVKRLVAVLGSPAPQRKVQVPVTVTTRPDRTLQDLAKRYPTVIAVDRDAKILRLYKYLQLEHKYKIAVGQAGLETTAGRYKIEEKIVNPDWHVPDSDWAGDLAGRTIPAGDPQNPLEARYMGFHDGEGIHGTAELSSLGSAASHGCIRMSVPDVNQLYRQVKVGTPVFIQ